MTSKPVLCAIAFLLGTGLGIASGTRLGIVLGMGYRDQELIKNTRTYSGVTVVSQQSDHEYSVLIPGYSKIWNWEFCHPLKMPSPVIDIKYEQRYGCKAVNGVGFVSIHQEKNNGM